MERVAEQVKVDVEVFEKAGKALEAEAAQDIANLIETARAAYDYELNRTVDKIDDLANNTLTKIQTMLNDLISGVLAKMQDLMDQATAIEQSLPGVSHRAAVSTFGPRSYASPGTGTLLLKVGGIFYFAGDPNYTPTLTISNNPTSPIFIKPYITTLTELDFQVPSTALVGSTSNILMPANAITVSVPWDTSGVLGVGKQKKTSTFSVGVLSLPPDAGTVTIRSLDKPTPGSTINEAIPRQTVTGESARVLCRSHTGCGSGLRAA